MLVRTQTPGFARSHGLPEPTGGGTFYIFVIAYIQIQQTRTPCPLTLNSPMHPGD